MWSKSGSPCSHGLDGSPAPAQGRRRALASWLLSLAVLWAPILARSNQSSPDNLAVAGFSEGFICRRPGPASRLSCRCRGWAFVRWPCPLLDPIAHLPLNERPGRCNSGLGQDCRGLFCGPRCPCFWLSQRLCGGVGSRPRPGRWASAGFPPWPLKWLLRIGPIDREPVLPLPWGPFHLVARP